MFGLIDGWILLSPAFNQLLQVLVEGNEENLALYTCNCQRIEAPLRGLGNPSEDPLATFWKLPLDEEWFL